MDEKHAITFNKKKPIMDKHHKHAPDALFTVDNGQVKGFCNNCGDFLAVSKDAMANHAKDDHKKGKKPDWVK